MLLSSPVRAGAGAGALLYDSATGHEASADGPDPMTQTYSVVKKRPGKTTTGGAGRVAYDMPQPGDRTEVNVYDMPQPEDTVEVNVYDMPQPEDTTEVNVYDMPQPQDSIPINYAAASDTLRGQASRYSNRPVYATDAEIKSATTRPDNAAYGFAVTSPQTRSVYATATVADAGPEYVTVADQHRGGKGKGKGAPLYGSAEEFGGSAPRPTVVGSGKVQSGGSGRVVQPIYDNSSTIA